MRELHDQLAAVRAAHPTRRCEIGGHTWTHLEAGSGGATLLLLPGALGEEDTSFQYILALQASYRVVSLGYPPTLDRLPALLDGLDMVLRRLHVTQAHIVGGSYSGLVAQYFAAHWPGRVRSLLLSNIGAPSPSLAPLWSFAARVIHLLPEPALQRLMGASIRRFLPGDSPAERFWRSYFASALPTWSKGAVVTRLRLMSQLHGRANAAHLRRTAFRGPVLIINAEGDRLVSRRERQALRALYPQAQHAAITDKGHVASLDEAAAYIRIYQEFLCNLGSR